MNKIKKNRSILDILTYVLLIASLTVIATTSYLLIKNNYKYEYTYDDVDLTIEMQQEERLDYNYLRSVIVGISGCSKNCITIYSNEIGEDDEEICEDVS